MFATRPIKRGAYIATYRGRIIPDEEAERREARGARYMFELTKKKTIDGSPRWNIARYINHSCKPNAKPVGRKGGIVIVADRRIEPDEEITYSYGKEYLQYFIEFRRLQMCRLPKNRARNQEAARGVCGAKTRGSARHKTRGGAKRKARSRASPA